MELRELKEIKELLDKQKCSVVEDVINIFAGPVCDAKTSAIGCGCANGGFPK